MLFRRAALALIASLSARAASGASDRFDDPFTYFYVDEATETLVSPAQLGVDGEPLPHFGIRYSAATKGAVYVTSIVRFSPAHRAGIMAGERIVEVDGIRIEDSDHFARLTSGSAGKGVALTVLRGDASRRVSLVKQPAHPVEYLKRLTHLDPRSPVFDVGHHIVGDLPVVETGKCRLIGRVLVDGKVREGLHAALLVGSKLSRTPFVEPDADGRFEIHVSTAASLLRGYIIVENGVVSQKASADRATDWTGISLDRCLGKRIAVPVIRIGAPIELRQPAAGGLVPGDEYEFAWSPVPGARQYELQVFTPDSALRRGIDDLGKGIHSIIVQEPRYCCFSPPKWERRDVARMGGYHWRVYALDDRGNPFRASSPGSGYFFPDAPPFVFRDSEAPAAEDRK